MSRDVQQAMAQSFASSGDPTALRQSLQPVMALGNGAAPAAASAPQVAPAMPAFTPPQAQYSMPQWAAGLGGNRMQPLYQFRPWGGGGLGFQPSVGGYTGLLNGMIRR